ncbi:DUF1214 domain-containing protein [Tunturibacter psychrotolerans]|uniref:DUF1214 domain-containing protein n=1 Tax=Tunturiibacter psychrotolerans TaxID=3069686 RepID=A0AAU7ZP24_9BACT
MSSLIQDIRHAIRQLLKSPGFTITAILSLACGIAATSAVFSVVWGVVMNPYPYAAPDRMVHFGPWRHHGQRLQRFGDHRRAMATTAPASRNHFLARATGTQMGIGANSRDETLYPILDKDADGQPFDGSKSEYPLHSAKGQFLPVNAFWSLTMYDLPSQLLVKNSINRYLINSPMLPHLKLDKDGGLTLYIQADSPGAEKQANWLPAPKVPHADRPLLLAEG